MEEKNVEERIQLAKAAVQLQDLSPDSYQTVIFSSSKYKEPDKLDVPDKWEKLVEKIRFFYERDPIASTVVNKSVDIGMNEIENNRGDASDKVFEVYESFRDKLQAFLKDVAREYLLSGLVIPEVTWVTKGTMPVNEMESEEDFSSVYTLPDQLWLRDPTTIRARQTPIPNRINYYIKIDGETEEFILNKGRYSDGTVDKETYQMLVKDYPEFVRAVREGKTELPLENPFMVIRRAPLAGKAYPTPYLLGILESLSYKRKLRKMDYSIAARVISAIQLITLGNDDYPLTEADEDQLNDLKEQMRWRGKEGNIERVFQLFGNHTLEISWIYPDTEALLDKGKYEAVDKDIMFGLGFPRILLSGETERSATSNPEFALLSPAATIEAMRRDIMPFIKKLYAEVARYNGFESHPTLEFAPLKLYDIEKMSQVVMDMYERGLLSRTSYLSTVGHEFEDEIFNILRERELMKKYDIPEFAPVPFSPQPGTPGGQNTNPNGDNQDA